MFEITVKPIVVQNQWYKEKYYKCPNCSADLKTVHGYRMNCSSCFKWLPTIADLLNSNRYRLKYHTGKEQE